MIQFLSLFSGIGAPEKALDRLGVEYNLVNYCEIDKYASRSYSAIHNVPESLNLGDITKVDTGKLPNIDMVFYGFPCQDISTAGYMKGLFNEDGSKTRSGLFFEALRIIEDTKPAIAIAENVKNLTSKKFAKQFDIVLNSLDHAGYNNYWKVLNAKDYGIPQKRERVFIVSIRKDLDPGSFKFPEPFTLELRLKDMLDNKVDEKYYLSNEKVNSIMHWKATTKPLRRVLGNNSVSHCLTARGAGEEHSEMLLYDDQLENTTNVEEIITVREATKKGYAEAYEGDSINLEQPNSKTRRGRVGRGVAQTLTTSPQQGVVEPNFINGDVSKTVRTGGHGSLDRHSWDMVKCESTLRIRKLTPLECFRLMGFDDEDFYKAEKVNSNTQLYKQAGNSIVVDVLEYLFKEILEVVDMQKVDNKVTVFEGDDLINLVALKEKEPDLYEELLADYPCESGTYIFNHKVQKTV